MRTRQDGSDVDELEQAYTACGNVNGILSRKIMHNMDEAAHKTKHKDIQTHDRELEQRRAEARAEALKYDTDIFGASTTDTSTLPASLTDTAQEASQQTEDMTNPLLTVLREDEIYIDPFEVTIEEAEENGYPLLRRDIVTYRWWLEFPFDTREQPELHQALNESKWRWGGYRQQWHNASHFPDMPKDMYYANAGPAFYSEEN